MDFRHHISGGSPSSSSTTSSSSHNPHHHHNPTTTTTPTPTTDPIHSWWESISKARSRIQLLSTILQPEPDSPNPNPNPISSLADSDNPAHSLLSSLSSYTLLSLSLSSPSSGSGHDPLCHWLYDTFLSSDPLLRLVVLSFIPLISGLYLSRLHSSPSLSGFEAVLLSLYSHETKSRAGKPLLINIPDLSLPSLYHSPRPINSNNNNVGNINNINNNVGSGKKGNMGKGNNAGVLMKTGRETVGVLAAPLEPQTAIKSTKRAVIVGVALDCYYKVISQMPSWSKRDFCRFAADWAGQDCVCKSEFDRIEENVENEEAVRVSDDGEDENHENHENHEIEIEDNVVESMKNLEIEDENLNGGVRGTRIMLPWELLQPTLRILGHCLLGPLNSDDVKDAASVAVRCLYARASHDLVPQAILATRSLIQLDKRAREAAKMAAASAANTAGSNANTPSKAKKPEILLVSK